MVYSAVFVDVLPLCPVGWECLLEGKCKPAIDSFTGAKTSINIQYIYIYGQPGLMKKLGKVL